MKRTIAGLLALLLLLGCLACAKPEPGTELVVFAAASLTETLTEIGSAYTTEHPNVTLRFNFDSSGTLKTQIEQGAVCDLFLSAAPKQMNALDGAVTGDANPNGQDLLLQGTRCDLLENKVALVVPDGNPKGVKDFADAMDRVQKGELLLAIGNADVPVGQYTKKIFAYFGVEEAAIAPHLTYGGNVKEVTAQVGEAAADCGVVYATDAFSAKLTVLDTATEEMCGRVVYPAAVLKDTKHEAEARAFLDYLRGEAASAVFAGVGFTPLG